MLIKRRDAVVQKTRLQSMLGDLSSGVLDRRAFLRRAGFTAGAVGLAGLPLGSVKRPRPPRSIQTSPSRR